MFEHAAFLSVGSCLVIAQVFGLIKLGHIRLDSRLGLVRDGLPAGTPAPTWTRADTTGTEQQSPGSTAQVLVFTDHSLTEFPELAAGLREISKERLQALILTSKDPALTDAVARTYGVAIPIVAGHDLYARYRVRVVPFAIVVLESGAVGASAYVNSEESLRELVVRATSRESLGALV